MRTVYFDTCIYGDIAKEQISREDYHILLRAASAQRVRVIFSMAVMDELSRLCAKNPAAGKTQLAIARSICARQGVRYHTEILREEVCALLDGMKRPTIFMSSGGP